MHIFAVFAFQYKGLCFDVESFSCNYSTVMIGNLLVISVRNTLTKKWLFVSTRKQAMYVVAGCGRLMELEGTIRLRRIWRRRKIHKLKLKS